MFKLLATDVDGVLTDCGMYYTENGDEIKKFHTRDGMAIKLFQESGVRIAFVTGENTKLLKNRAIKLGVEDVFQGDIDKLPIIKALMKKYDLDFSEVAYVGDDIIDIPVLEKVKYAMCPSDAMPKVKLACMKIIKTKGGKGVIREIYELYKHLL